jgi:4'-phosphopantetheinyl transferase
LRAARGLDGSGVQVARDGSGKPFLPAHPDIHFSLSHSGSWILCAVHGTRVGVDVEEQGRLRDMPAEQLMSPAELECWKALPVSGRLAACYRLWTLKESILKAAGSGLSFDPRQVTLSWSGTETHVAGAPEPGTTWRVHEVTAPMPEHVYAAVCVEDRA